MAQHAAFEGVMYQDGLAALLLFPIRTGASSLQSYVPSIVAEHPLRPPTTVMP